MKVRGTVAPESMRSRSSLRSSDVERASPGRHAVFLIDGRECHRTREISRQGTWDRSAGVVVEHDMGVVDRAAQQDLEARRTDEAGVGEGGAGEGAPARL